MGSMRALYTHGNNLRESTKRVREITSRTLSVTKFLFHYQGILKINPIPQSKNWNSFLCYHEFHKPQTEILSYDTRNC